MIIGSMMAPSVLSEVVNIFWTSIILLKSSHMFKKHWLKCPRCVIVRVIHNWFYYEWFLLLFWFWLFIIMMFFFDWFLILYNPLLFVNLLGLIWVLFLRFDFNSMYWFTWCGLLGRFYFNAICCLRSCLHVFDFILKMRFWTFFSPVISQIMRWMWKSLW